MRTTRSCPADFFLDGKKICPDRTYIIEFAKEREVVGYDWLKNEDDTFVVMYNGKLYLETKEGFNSNSAVLTLADSETSVRILSMIANTRMNVL